MSERIHLLAQQIFGKSSIEECTLAEIKDLANRYPYFAPAQFLLLEKLKQEKAPEYEAQLQKSVLYYHNPLEFEYFISSDQFYTEVNVDESTEPAAFAYDLTEDVTPDNAIIEESPTEEVQQILIEENNDSNVEEPSEETVVENTTDQMTGHIEKVLQFEEEQIKPVPENTNDLVFEPFHTVDYFASQGIKLSQEETSKDKFGRQLKSFTEWLKTMKRLPAKEIDKTIDETSESKVQHLAADSVHESDIVTEAMAEVWVKQGNRQKAIETYNKLSLLNPSKKAYFADLIENLKRS